MEAEEEKKKMELRQNSHHRKSSLQYVFQVETDTFKLHQFCIPRKELKTYEDDTPFSDAMGFYHVENSFYLGGGTNWS